MSRCFQFKKKEYLWMTTYFRSCPCIRLGSCHHKVPYYQSLRQTEEDWFFVFSIINRAILRHKNKYVIKSLTQDFYDPSSVHSLTTGLSLGKLFKFYASAYKPEISTISSLSKCIPCSKQVLIPVGSQGSHCINNSVIKPCWADSEQSRRQLTTVHWEPSTNKHLKT